MSIKINSISIAISNHCPQITVPKRCTNVVREFRVGFDAQFLVNPPLPLQKSSSAVNIDQSIQIIDSVDQIPLIVGDVSQVNRVVARPFPCNSSALRIDDVVRVLAFVSLESVYLRSMLVVLCDELVGDRLENLIGLSSYAEVEPVDCWDRHP